ncbi:flavin reductase [Microvirga pakistanensis]|uniref:flavin reductase n=1 Tax=Microvirga pakistanensis TaxID=1682650 RepID=UPI00106B200C|nr:flavin reductase family protein [Microvirga pakistanensis]
MLATNDREIPIDPLELRRALGTFVTGVTVVTTRDRDGQPRGMTANSFTSVSLDPPLLLICIGKSAGSFQAFSTASSFAVNILHEQQTEVSRLFASKAPDKFAGVSYDTVHTGAPILTDCLSWFDCTVHNTVDAGDHLVIIGCVQAFGTTPAAPLGFCRGRYAHLKDPLPPGWMPARDMVASYLVVSNGRILLREDEGGWTLPTGRRQRAGNLVTLNENVTISLLPDETFLYSVFDVADKEPGYIVYRGVLADGGPDDLQASCSLRFFALADIPWDRIAVRQIRTMLRRFVHEHNQARFGIYIDTDDGGRVAMIEGPPRPWHTIDTALGK